MKLNYALALSLVVHIIIICLFIRYPLSKKASEKPAPILNAVLYLPTVKHKKDIAEPRPENIPTAEAVSFVDEHNNKPKNELKDEPTPKPLDNDDLADTPSKVSAPPAKIDVAEATRQALTQLQSSAYNALLKQQQEEYDTRDSRLIENAPRQPILNGPAEISIPIIETDCSESLNKGISIASSLLGGGIRCRENSKKELNHFINRRLHKLEQEP